MSQRAARPGGHRTTSGVRARLHADGLPTRAELRQLSAAFDGSSRFARCGRVGKRPNKEFEAHLLSRLAAASRSGRGLCDLSRDEVDALVRLMGVPLIHRGPKQSGEKQSGEKQS